MLEKTPKIDQTESRGMIYLNRTTDEPLLETPLTPAESYFFSGVVLLEPAKPVPQPRTIPEGVVYDIQRQRYVN